MRLRGGRASVVLAVFGILLLLSPFMVHVDGTGAQGAVVVPTHVCSCTAPTTPGEGNEIQRRDAPIASNYDEQLGITFTQSFTSLEYNVTAVEQTDPVLGDGPAYLVNGLSNAGYWYQVGFSWNWSPGSSPGTGFDMNYEVFDYRGNSVFPTGGQGGVASFSGPVSAGDTILLDLYITNATHTVTMLAEDTSTGASALETYSSEDATYFVGLPGHIANSNGFFTGLMTEWYHGAPYYSNEAAVVYSDPSVQLASAWMWIDEFDASNFHEVFSANTSAPVSFADVSKLREFAFNGTTEYADAYEFATGALANATSGPSTVPLVFSFGAEGKTTGYSAPVLTYFSNGTQYKAALTGTATAYYLDVGTTWKVSSVLAGSTSDQRWATDQPTTGIADAPSDVSMVYTEQELVTFEYSVENASPDLGPPTVTYTSFGSSAATSTGMAVWADLGGTYQYASPLSGSTATQRWSAPTRGSIGSAHTITATYHRQDLVTFKVAFKDTEVLPALSLTSTSLGQPYSATLVAGTSVEWLDAGSAYSVPQSFSLEPGQRLLAKGATSGYASPNETVFLTYEHQFLITVSQNVQDGGTISPASGWYDSGSLLELRANASVGWTFEDWQGAGSDSVSGTTPDLSLTVGPGTPANETAVFYPAVSIYADGPASVSYSDGAVSGSVSPGQTTRIYVPPSSILKLAGSGTPFLTRFDGWSGSNSSDLSTLSIRVDGPTAMSSSSSYDLLGIGIFVVIVALIAAVGVYLVSRGRSGDIAGRAAPPSRPVTSASAMVLGTVAGVVLKASAALEASAMKTGPRRMTNAKR